MSDAEGLPGGPTGAAGVPASADDPRVDSARTVVTAYLKAARALQLYPAQSKVRQDHVTEFADRIAGHLEQFGELELRVRQASFDHLGVVLHEEPVRQGSAPFRLFVNGVRRIVVRPGLRRDEAEGVVEVLARSSESHSTTDDLRTAVWEKCFDHVAFTISDDLLTDAEEREFAQMVEEGRTTPDTARSARLEAEPLLEELAALPEPPYGDPEALLRVTRDDRDALVRDVAEEERRDILAEFGDSLVRDVADRPEAELSLHLEEFLEHLLTTGRILRAARLLAALRDVAGSAEDPQRRRLLTDVVERIGRARVMPKLRPLVPQLAQEDRQALVALLVAVGELAVPPLADLLDSPARDSAYDALRVLAPRHPRSLLPFLESASPAVVRSVLSLLGESGAPDIAPGLSPALRHADTGVRRDAVRALEKLGGPATTELLLSALGDSAYEVRALALAALAQTKDERAAAPLIERVSDRAFHALTRFEKRETLRTLALIGTKEAVTALVRLLSARKLVKRERVDETRVLAVQALAMIGSPAAFHALQLHAGDRSDSVRRAVLAALQSGARPE